MRTLACLSILLDKKTVGNALIDQTLINKYNFTTIWFVFVLYGVSQVFVQD